MSFAKPITILYIIGISATIHKTKGQPLNFSRDMFNIENQNRLVKFLEVYTLIKGMIGF